jgi:hypothetical protein
VYGARRAVPAIAAALALIAPATAVAGLDDRGYLAFADRMQQRLDPVWDEDAGYYRAGSGGVEPMTNSLVLLTHSVAAMADHHGPARNDRRARLVARRLVDGLPFVSRRPHGRGDSQVHAPGFVSSMTDAGAPQHLVFDAEVIDGLAVAYRARHALGLPEETSRKIRGAIHRTANGRFWRWPTIRLNQVNWYALVYAADATVTGDGRLLRRDLALQLRRFFRGAAGSGGRAGNFGAGMRFHYLPYSSPAERRNVDSAEYANIVLSFTRFYAQARRAGMPPLEPRARRLLREWTRRAIAGYWTHSGYMNWDSGLGFERWHQAKKLGLTQQALIGLAASPSLLPGRAWAGWAKDVLDRGLAFYERQADGPGGLPDPVFFGVSAVPQTTASARLAAARMQANAARALDAGLGRMRAVRPPSLYAYDPDIGRLAISTRSYNTAVVPVNQGAFPYGGLDLARLFDAEQDVLANIGGSAPAGFGLVVRDARGATALATQVARRQAIHGVRPLRLTRAPAGVGASAASLGRAYAGAFRAIEASGGTRGHGYAATVAHRFTRDYVRTRWLLRRTGARGSHTADVLFPSWGGRRAAVTAVLRDGRRVVVGGGRSLALRAVHGFEIRSAHGGYRVSPVRAPRGASARIVHPAPKSSNPLPGPSLAIRIGSGAVRGADFTARIAPARSGPLAGP